MDMKKLCMLSIIFKFARNSIFLFCTLEILQRIVHDLKIAFGKYIYIYIGYLKLYCFSSHKFFLTHKKSISFCFVKHNTTEYAKEKSFTLIDRNQN